MTRLARVRPRTLVVAAGLTVGIGVLLFAVWPLPRVEALGGGPILDARFAASGTDAPAYLAALGAEGRWRYALLATGDLVWAVLHGLTVAAGIAVGVTRSRLDDRLAVAAVVPLAYLVLDGVENLSVLAALSAHPAGPPVPTAVMDLTTGGKFVALGAAYLLLFGTLAAWAVAARARPAPS